MKKTQPYRTKIIFTLSLLIILQHTISCVDAIDFDLDPNKQHLVVDGFITNQCGPHAIRLSQSTDYQSDSIINPVTGANVYLRDHVGVAYRLTEENGMNGIYNTSNDFEGIPCQSYTLHIVTTNGKEYASVPELLKEAPPIDTLYWEFTSIPFLNEYNNISDKEGVQYYIDFKFPSNDNQYLMWQWEETFLFRSHYHDIELPLNCYVTQQSENFVRIMSNEDLSFNEIIDFELLFHEPDFRYVLRYSLNVKQYEISKTAYDFYEQMENQINNTGSIFDSTPAQINGNIYNVNDPNELVLGYFGAYGVSEKRTFVDAYNLPYEFEMETYSNRGNYIECLLTDEGEIAPDYCYDCILYPNSTYELPDFW